MSSQVNEVNKEVWGCSRVGHGVVMLDWDITTNSYFTDRDGNLILLRCKDWVHYVEDPKNWNVMHYGTVDDLLKSWRGDSKFPEVERELMYYICSTFRKIRKSIALNYGTNFSWRNKEYLPKEWGQERVRKHIEQATVGIVKKMLIMP